ncbi:MAG TPA: serine O-acetyltransferase EpsC [Drouetiella sp.]|jgi:serine O-acetyltransferase
MSLKEEVENILMKDPAARSRAEVFLCYPGFHAILIYRLAHKLWQTNNKTLRVVARSVSQLGRFLTGIEIHPGAKIGQRLFIDHGLGVVIGETAEIGDDCVLYQGVTLGAQAAARMGALSRDTKRHPTLGDSVVVGSGAQILGGFTVGNNVQVASGSILLKEVADDCIVVGVPGRVIYRQGVRVSDPVPDIEAEAIKCLRDKIAMLEKQVDRIQNVPIFEPTLTGAKRPTAGNVVQMGNVATVGAATSDAVDIFLHGAGI